MSRCLGVSVSQCHLVPSASVAMFARLREACLSKGVNLVSKGVKFSLFLRPVNEASARV